MTDFNDLQRMSYDLVCRTVDAIEHRARSILRHWYAGCALAGLLADPNVIRVERAAEAALECADEMLARLEAERAKGGES
jgi:hypothetical protein